MGVRVLNARATAKSRGFSLVELMIVVAILGVLASVAGTAFGFYMERSKLAETTSLLESLVNREVTYFQVPRYAEDGTAINPCYVAFNVAPATIGLTKRPFVEPTGKAAEIGFAPSGDIYSSFSVIGPGGTAGVCWTTDYAPAVTLSNQWYVRVNGYANLDGDSDIRILSFFGIDSAYARNGFSGTPCDPFPGGSGYTTNSYFTRWLGTGPIGAPRVGNMFVMECSG